MSPKFFPALIITLFLAASVVYFWRGDIRMGTYHLAAAVLNIAVSY